MFKQTMRFKIKTKPWRKCKASAGVTAETQSRQQQPRGGGHSRVPVPEVSAGGGRTVRRAAHLGAQAGAGREWAFPGHAPAAAFLLLQLPENIFKICSKNLTSFYTPSFFFFEWMTAFLAGDSPKLNFHMRKTLKTVVIFFIFRRLVCS